MSKYMETGVDVDKKDIRLFTSTDQDLYEHSFCKIYRHPARPDVVFSKHADGVGSKSVQRYLHFKETGDAAIFEGDAQDDIEMNLGDVMCVGLQPLSFTDYLAISHMVTKATYIQALNKGIAHCFSRLKDHGIKVIFAGGETADLPDQEKTYDLVGDVYAEGNERDVITGGLIENGDIIIGVRSGGKAVWENKVNSGHMSNGSTLARHSLMLHDYEVKYPEIRGKMPYTGRFRTDQYHRDLGMTVGEALTSPTRHFSIVINELLKRHKEDIHGLVLNTGGGQTKCLRLGNNIQYVKDFTDTQDHDPLFYLVKQESKERWEDMFRDYNMGFGLDVIAPEAAKRSIIYTIQEIGIGAEQTGNIKKHEGKNALTINSRFGTFNYPK